MRTTPQPSIQRRILNMSQALYHQLHRLFLLPSQVFHDQSQDGENYYPAGQLTDKVLAEHLAGERTVALNLVDGDGRTRCLVLDFDGSAHGKGVEHWQALCKTANGLQEDLGLSAPAVSVSGRKGYGLWISLADPVPVSQAQQFLHLLRKKYLADIPKEELDLRPDTDKATKAAQAVAKLPPCLHRASNKWAAFITGEVGEVFAESPGLEYPPSLDKQAALLADIEPNSVLAFLKALAELQTEYGESAKQQDGPKLIPIYAAGGPAYIPPCIQSLVGSGVPHDMQYNTANMNLHAYCTSAQMPKDQAMTLAEKMAHASEDHPTAKSVSAKLKNFASNPARPFYCDYPRNTPAWWKQYGGLKSCSECSVNPGSASDKQTSQKLDSANTATLEAAVALDLLAYYWQLNQPLPQIRNVWPVVSLEDDGKLRSAPWYRVAAEALDSGATSAAYFKRVDSALAEIRISGNAATLWRASASAFLDKLRAHQVTAQQGKAAEQRGLHMERRHTLEAAVQHALKLGPEISANTVAMKLRGAAEDTLKAESGNGPLIGLRGDLFKGLARQVSEVVPTPFPRLNGLLHGGWRGGRLYVLLAPPKAGKTTLMGVVMDYAAAHGYPTLYVGYEMAREQMVEYAMARRLKINSKRIETRDLSEAEAELVAANLDAYLEQEGKYLEIWEAGLTTAISDMAAWVTKQKAANPGKTPLVVIDYLQLAYTGIPEIDRHPSETKRVSEVAVACKHLARQTGAAVIALSSVTKSAETDSRLSGEIDVTAARDSLAIIHAADGVLALQTATVLVSEGKGENKTETEMDPWAWLASQLRVQGQESDALALERGLAKLEKDYAQGGFPGIGVRTRLSLLRHRGSTGDVALYYRRAFHHLEEVALPGLPPVEQGQHKAELSISVFQKYVDQHAGPVDPVQPAASDTTHEAYADEDEYEPNSFPNYSPLNPAPTLPYQFIDDQATALAAIAGLSSAPVVGIDLETTGLSPIASQARLMQLSDGSITLVIDLWKCGGLSAFKQALQKLRLVAHNSVFEMGFLYRAGINLTLDCTMLAAHVLTGIRTGLKDLVKQYLGIEMSKAQQTSDWSQDYLSEEQLSYAALDAQVLPEIFGKLSAEIEERNSQKAYTLARDAQPAIVRMELAGMPFNAEKQAALIAGMTAERDAYLARIRAALGADFNPNSGSHLSAWILEQVGAGTEKYKAWPKTASGKQFRTGADDLRKGLVYLSDSAAELVRDVLLPYKEVEKRLSAFGTGLADKINPLTHRIHADFQLAGAATGRMACSNPNLQQIPRDKVYRALFEAPQGRAFVICDYSQMELRVAAEIAQEQELIEAYRNGQDTHRKTAAMLLNKSPKDVTKGERQLAKAVNFGLLFGQGAKGLKEYAASSYGVEISEDQARQYRESWFKAYPAFRTWHQKSGRQAEKTLSVRTPAGRERRWASAKDFAVTAAYNTPVQGGAAEAMLASLAHLDKALYGLDAEPVAVVHDELIVECAEGQEEAVKAALEQSMVQGFKDIFPQAPLVDVVEASVGKSWADK